MTVWHLRFEEETVVASDSSPALLCFRFIFQCHCFFFFFRGGGGFEMNMIYTDDYKYIIDLFPKPLHLFISRIHENNTAMARCPEARVPIISLPDVKVAALMTQQNQLEKAVGFEGVDLFSSPHSLMGARCTPILFSLQEVVILLEHALPCW